MTHYDDVIMPLTVRFGSVSTPMVSTTVDYVDSGYRKASARWDHHLRQLTLDYANSANVSEAIPRIFQAVGGPANSFLCRDWADWNTTLGRMVKTDSARISHIDQPLQNTATGFDFGDGVTNTYQMLKAYTSDVAQYLRAIQKPQQGTILIGINSVLQSNVGSPSNYDVDYSTGLVTFSSPPPLGQAVTWGGAFYLPVAFEEDQLTLVLNSENTIEVTTLLLKEQRL